MASPKNNVGFFSNARIAKKGLPGQICWFSWSVDSPLCTFSDSSLRQPVLTCDDNGDFTISMTVEEDGDYVTADTTITVSNVAPTISEATAPGEIEENGLIELVVRFEDPGVMDTHTLSVDWGDGASETLAVPPGAREIVANHGYEDDNPLCGDKIRIEIRVDKNGFITEAVFRGRGCSISQASADLVIESIIGKSIEEVKQMTKEDVLDILGIELGPVRLKCALLPLKVLKAGVYGLGIGEASDELME